MQWGSPDEGSGAVLDFGAGAGYHARVLASRGFTVTAVDTSDTPLKEPGEVCGRDARDDAAGGSARRGQVRRASAPPELILCVGTYAGSPTVDEGRGQAHPHGRAVAGARWSAAASVSGAAEEPSPQDSVIKMRAERDRIMQCMPHFEPERVWVTDVVA